MFCTITQLTILEILDQDLLRNLQKYKNFENWLENLENNLENLENVKKKYFAEWHPGEIFVI